MPAFLDFLSVYIMGGLQIVTGFHFFTKFLGKNVNLFYYFVFVVLGILFICTGNTPDLLIYILLLAACGFFIYKARVIEVILYAVLAALILQLCYGVFNSATGILFPFMLYFNNNIPGILFIITGNLALPAGIIYYKVLYKYFLYNGTIKSQYILMGFVPVLMLFLTESYISSEFYGSAVIIGKGCILNIKHLKILFIQFLGIASLNCILAAYKNILENFNLVTELSLIKQEEYLLEKYAEEAKSSYEKTKSFRHDIRNHIIVIRELLQSGKIRQALDYTSDMEGMAKEMLFACNTNNPVVDILTRNKLGAAKENGIDARCFLVLPYPCAVRDIDFCIIISNLLDNAVHACQKMDFKEERFIYMAGKVQGDFILIEVKNSFNGKSSYREGTGLSNIRMAAEKYNGAVNINVCDKIFTVSVLLVIPVLKKDIPGHKG